MLLALWESFIQAGIRFWDARFPGNTLIEEIEYLKLEVEKERQEKRKLLDHIMELNKPIERAPDVSLEDYQPLNKTVPWRSKRMQLEQDDKKEFERLKKQKLEEAKSTEQLEKELLNDVG